MTKSTDQARIRRPHPVARSEFARRAKRTPAAITQACQGPLKAACLPGGRIDASHPAVLAWAQKRKLDPASLLDPEPAVSGGRTRGRPTAAAKVAEAKSEAMAPDLSAPARINDLLDMPLREILARHQSIQGFGDWLDRRKKISDIAKTEFHIALKRDLYMPRHFVEQHLLGLIETTNLRLLREVVTTATSELYALAKSGRPLEEGHRALRGIIGANLKYAADTAAKLIRTSRSDKPQKPRRKTPR
jgi:hypothetical protein